MINRFLRLLSKNGFVGIFVIIINIILYNIFRVLPINDSLIVLESDGDLCDNSYALFDYLKNNNYLEKYHIVWLVHNLDNKEEIKNVSYVRKEFSYLSIKRDIYLATCKLYIFDHVNVYKNIPKRKGTRLINLCHGTPIKGIKSEGDNDLKKKKQIEQTEFMCAPSEYWAKYTADFYWGSYDCVKAFGYPRNDYFFKEKENSVIKFAESKKWNTFSKVVFWMPTFRLSSRKVLSEKYFLSETGLPILLRGEDLRDFNKYLSSLNMLVVFKVHHLQAESNSFKKTYSNIQILEDGEIERNKIQLYQLIPLSDALITDYSSISNDYILLDLPMIFTLDDYEEYRNSRGFYIDNPVDYFAGYHIYDKSQLFDALKEIADDKDRYSDVRNNLLPILNKHRDGNASKRIVEYLRL